MRADLPGRGVVGAQCGNVRGAQETCRLHVDWRRAIITIDIGRMRLVERQAIVSGVLGLLDRYAVQPPPEALQNAAPG